MMPRMVGLVAVVAMALVGVAPAVVCAMPPECPMSQISSAMTRTCCTAVVPSGDGWAKAPCHPQVVSALVARIVDATPSLVPAFLVAAVSTSPELSTPLLVSAPPSTVPRFLLTHTFRL